MWESKWVNAKLVQLAYQSIVSRQTAICNILVASADKFSFNWINAFVFAYWIYQWWVISKLNNLSTYPQELHPRKISIGRIPSQETARTAFKLLAPSSLNWSCHRPIVFPWKMDLCESVSCCPNVRSNSCFVISGYWEGPDIEDGWGILEAYVYHIL